VRRASRNCLSALRTNDRTSERHVPSVAITPDGKTLACGIGYEAVKLWDAATGRERLSIQAHRARVWGLAISPDGTLLASGAWDGTIKFWDLLTGKERASFPAHKDRVYALAFTPDGKTLVSGGGIQFKRGEVKLWDLSSTRTTCEGLDHRRSAVLLRTCAPAWVGPSAGAL
jgi:WD40 repeat protein